MNLPECPWPEDVWTATTEEAGQWLRAKIGDDHTTAISGSLMRHGWDLAMKEIAPELEELRRFKAAALTLTSEASVRHVLDGPQPIIQPAPELNSISFKIKAPAQKP